jgi:acyl-CoA thioesterase-1
MKNLLKIITIFSLLFSAYAQKKVLFLGDSLTEGYGIAKENSYPVVLQKVLKSKHNTSIEILNGSVSGSTTASSLSRLKWFLRGKPDVLILALGANDGLRGVDLSSSKENLKKTIILAKENSMKVILAGMYIPPNYGPKYTKEFRQMYKDLEKEMEVILVPFLLEGVASVKELNLSDGIHPNEKGHKVMAKTLIKYIRPLL